MMNIELLEEHRNENAMKYWINKSWLSIIQYKPKVGILLNGWFDIHFLKEEDVEKDASYL